MQGSQANMKKYCRIMERNNHNGKTRWHVASYISVVELTHEMLNLAPAGKPENDSSFELFITGRASCMI